MLVVISEDKNYKQDLDVNGRKVTLINKEGAFGVDPSGLG
jgi:hypothetical protein